MLRKTLLISLTLVLSFGTFAQHSSLKGTVRNMETSELVPFAAVVVINGTTRVGAAATDIDGEYFINSLPTGKWSVLCRVVGYKPARIDNVLIKTDSVTQLRIGLKPRDGEGGDVQIYEYKVPLIDKESYSLGPAISAEDIEKMPGRSVLGSRIHPPKEFHVSKQGDDHNPGSQTEPFRNINAASRVAQAGDVITVHEGVYRERIDPRTPGESEARRMIYRAAPGESVKIKGSEIIKKWKPVQKGVWMVEIMNSFFGDYNPYADVIGVDWYDDRGRDHHTGEVYLNDKSLYEVASLEGVINPKILARSLDPEGSLYAWYCTVDEEKTIIYANFHDYNPNKELVEINVREACFYPSQPGMNYITVRGFHMSQAACQWSTAADEQNGLIGTHWSKGWIIENNIITHSKNIGIALGKDRKSGHRECSKNPDKPGDVVYNEVIIRALEGSGWSKDNIGSHIVRNNTIYNCEKNGIHGSLGAVFSTIENNHIYNIYTKRQYGGPDIGGIKILGAIDVIIRNNHIHNAHRGLWMDWMAQGTRISSNLLYDNDSDDLFVEVNHGPFVIDNNIFLSNISLRDWSQGGAYMHNLFGGKIVRRTVTSRKTPYHEGHSTTVLGIEEIFGGDNRFYNNIFAQTGLDVYDDAKLPMHVFGNIYLKDAKPYLYEHNYIQLEEFDPKISLDHNDGQVFVDFSSHFSFDGLQTKMITSNQLGKAIIPDLRFENPDKTTLKIDLDYFGNKRKTVDPLPGPFNALDTSNNLLVWE